MLREVLIFVSCGTAVYVWLCALVAPVFSASQQLIRHVADARAWGMLGLALGSALVWTLVPAAALFLLASLEPEAALAILQSASLDVAVLIGLIAWSIRATVFGVPRLDPDLEIAVALALVALVRDDGRTLGRVEKIYRDLVIAPAMTSGGRRSRSHYATA
jgi:hypothetical protein